MPAPSLIQYAETTWSVSATSVATASISWQAGDLIIAVSGEEGVTGHTLNTPTGTGLTFTSDAQTGGGGSQCNFRYHEATPSSSGSSAITFTQTPSASRFGGAVWVYRGWSGSRTKVNIAGDSAAANNLTRAQANSAVVLAKFDFNAGAPTGTVTPSAGATTRQNAVQGGMTAFIADWTDQGAAGTTSYGLTSAAAAAFTGILAEVKGTAAVGGGVMPPTVPPGLRHPVSFDAPGFMSRDQADNGYDGIGSGPGLAPYQIGFTQVTGTATTRVLTLTGSSDAGDTLLVPIQSNSNSGSVTAVTDSKGNTYVLDASQTTSPQLWAWRSQGATGGPGGGPTAALVAGDTVTITTAAISVNYVWRVIVVPWGALDAASVAVVNNTGTLNSPISITPNVDNDLVVVVGTDQFGPGCPYVDPPGTLIDAVSVASSAFSFAGYQALGVGSAGISTTLTFHGAGTPGIFRVYAYAFAPPPTGPTVWAGSGTASNTSAASGTLTQGITLTNSLEGGTSGTAVTAGNSGGASGNAFDTVVGTAANVTYDNSQAHGGGLSMKSFGGFPAWTTSLGTITGPVWAREYVWEASFVLADVIQWYTSGGSLCGKIRIDGTGHVVIQSGTGGTTQATSTTIIPTGSWFRLEAFCTGSTTVGQMEVKIFTSPDSTTPDETLTTAANINTTGTVGRVQFGIANSAANVWFDDLGASTIGYLGPAVAGPTTWAAAGTASNTSIASGTVTLLMAATGTASNTSQASGTVTLLMAAAGTASNTSAASGTVTLLMAAAGTASNASSASGTVGMLMAAAGTAVTASSASGRLSFPNIAGIASNTSAASGAITMTLAAVGTASNTSSTSGWLNFPNIAGIASNTSSASGVVTLRMAAAGTASNASSASGTIGAMLTGAGTAVNSSTASGTFGPIAIAGAASNTSSASGTITATLTVSATASNTSSASGAIAATLAAAGTASNVSAAAGSFGATISAAGTASNTSSASGVVTLLAAAAGTAFNTSAASGVVTLLMAAAGAAVTASAASGQLTYRNIAGTASSTSTASGAITATLAAVGTAVNASTAAGVFGAQAIAGVASNTSAASGALGLLMAAAGTAVTVSSASGSVTLTLAVAGTASTVSAAQGVFGAQAITASASNTSIASGVVTLTMAIAGTASNVSSTSGQLTFKNIAGTASNASTTSGAVAQIMAAVGTAVTASSAQGAFGAQAIAATASNTSVASGVVSLIGAIAGAASNASTASGTVTAIGAIVASAGNASIASGTIVALLKIAATASNTSVAQGSFGAQPIAGTSINTSAASGTVSVLLAIAGSATNVSTASGVLTTTYGIAGTATASSQAVGALVAIGSLTGTATGHSTATGAFTLRGAVAGTATTTSHADGIFGALPFLAGTAYNTSVTFADTFVISALLAALDLYVVPIVTGRIDTMAAPVGRVDMVPEALDRLDAVPEVVDRFNMLPWVVERHDLTV